MKIGFIGFMPPASIFPAECLRSKYNKPAHPAPWMVALLPALARRSKFKLRVFIVHRSLLRTCLVEKDGVEYYGVPSIVPERFGRATLYYQYSLALRGPVRQFAPDLIHAFGFETGAALIGLRTGRPVSCFIQGIAEQYFPYYKSSRSWIDRNVSRWAEGKAAKKIRWMVAETRHARQWALSKNPACKAEIIPHPLRSEFFEDSAPLYGKSILSVGTLDQRKGMDTIVRAFARVADLEARLVLVGGGRERDNLERLANELGVRKRVEFPGPLETNQVIERMNQARVFVIASRADTSPNVLSEAHAVGLPVVGTRAGGIPEMIEEGVDGYCVDVDDVGAMAERLEVLLADPDKAAEMGLRGREKVRVLNDPDRVSEAQIKFFDLIHQELSGE